MSKIFLWSASCVQEALLFYHSSFCLSRTFLIYFVVLSSSALQQLLYNIISDLICQELFYFSFRSDLYCSDRSPSATFIDYHIWSLVSRSFFILFRSQISSDVIFSCRSFSDVDYLTIAVYSMSTAFLCFFDNYFCHPYIVFSLSKLQYMDGIFHFIIDTLYLWFPKFKYALYFSFMISKNPAF